MKFKELQLKDFLSFKDLSIKFPDTAMAIQGINLDDDDQEANGTGKSSLFYGIEQAIMDSTSKGVGANELIRWGCKKSYLMLDIYCPVRKQSLIIERNINGSPKLALNTVDDGGQMSEVEFSSVIDGNNAIINWIGISKEDLQNYYIISRKRYTSFMTSSNTNKMAMLSRLTNLTPLDATKEVVDDMVQKKQNEINTNSLGQSKQEGILETLIDAIEKENNWDYEADLKESQDTINSQIDSTSLRLHRLKNKRDEYVQGIKSKLEEIPALQLDLDNIIIQQTNFQKEDLSKDMADIDNKVDTHSLKLEDIKSKRLEMEDELNESKSMLTISLQTLKGAVSCPSCHYEFNPAESDIDLVEEAKAVESLEGIIEGFLCIITQYKEQSNKVKKAISLLDEDKTSLRIKSRNNDAELNVINNKVIALRSKIQTLQAQIKDAKHSIISTDADIEMTGSQISSLEEQLNNLEIGVINTTRISELEVQVTESHSMTDDLVEQSAILLKEKNDLVRWGLNFNRFASDLAKESLDVITDRQNSVLSDMRSELRVRWEGFKIKKDGTLSDKITPIVVRNGFENPFGSYSGGERGRVEYSSILTSQNLINSAHKYGGLDFLFTDEIAEGIDGKGLVNIISSLGKLNRTILLTTHVVNQSVTANVLLVQKQNGVSTLLELWKEQ